MAEDKVQVYLCPHCGNKASLKVLYTATMTEQAEVWKGEFDSIEYYATLYQCLSCDNVLLIVSYEFDDNPSDANQGTLLYPIQKNIPEFVPVSIRSSYLEARKVEKISPTAFAVMIRRALEFLCEEQKAEGKTLSQKLQNLAQRKIIPETLAEMTNVLRILGNIGAHANDTVIKIEHVNAIKDFYDAIIEYVYIGPYKLKKLQESLKEEKESTVSR